MIAYENVTNIVHSLFNEKACGGRDPQAG